MKDELHRQLDWDTHSAAVLRLQDALDKCVMQRISGDLDEALQYRMHSLIFSAVYAQAYIRIEHSLYYYNFLD